MFTISPNKIITLTRGDTFTTDILLNVGTLHCPIYKEMKEGDFLYFAVMEPNQPFEKAILKKVFDHTDYKLGEYCISVRFDAEDTEYLVPGNYYYQVKLLTNHNNTDDGFQHVDTIIPKTKFIIVE